VSEASGPAGTILYRLALEQLELVDRTLVEFVWLTPRGRQQPARQQVKVVSSSRGRHGRRGHLRGIARTIRNFPSAEQGGGSSQGKSDPQESDSEEKKRTSVGDDPWVARCMANFRGAAQMVFGHRRRPHS
jgi:hypothetical protein